eukprot:5030748-Amphidinium_carterae.3
MVWRKSIDHIRRSSVACGVYSSSVYFRRAEDISIEFVPTLRQTMATQWQCSTSRQRWDSQSECGTLTNGNVTIKEQLHSGLIIQSARGHNETRSGT